MRIDLENPTGEAKDTDDILYYTEEDEASSPPGFYENPVVQPTLGQVSVCPVSVFVR